MAEGKKTGFNKVDLHEYFEEGNSPGEQTDPIIRTFPDQENSDICDCDRKIFQVANENSKDKKRNKSNAPEDIIDQSNDGELSNSKSLKIETERLYKRPDTLSSNCTSNTLSLQRVSSSLSGVSRDSDEALNSPYSPRYDQSLGTYNNSLYPGNYLARSNSSLHSHHSSTSSLLQHKKELTSCDPPTFITNILPPPPPAQYFAPYESPIITQVCNEEKTTFVMLVKCCFYLFPQLYV